MILKHYRLLSKNIHSLSDGQARLKQAADDDCLTTVLVTLAPRSGPYRGGQFDFEMDLSEGYPASPPTVRSLTTMYHPNVDCCFYDDDEDESSGDVCLNLLDELWSPDMNLEDVVQGLLFLLHEPNLEDPLSTMFDGQEDEEEFRRNVRRSLRGGVTIDGVRFQRNLAEGYESEGEGEQQGEEAPDHIIDNSAAVESKCSQIEELAQSSATDARDNESSQLQAVIAHHDNVESNLPPSPSPSLSPIPHSESPLVLDSPVDKELSSFLFSQRYISLNAFDKMWTLSLNSIIRTIVLGAQRTNRRSRADTTSDIGIR